MSPDDIMGDAVERLEWDERKEEDTPPKRWRQMTRRTALTGAALGEGSCAVKERTTQRSGASFVELGALAFRKYQNERPLDVTFQQEAALVEVTQPAAPRSAPALFGNAAPRFHP